MLANSQLCTFWVWSSSKVISYCRSCSHHTCTWVPEGVWYLIACFERFPIQDWLKTFMLGNITCFNSIFQNENKSVLEVPENSRQCSIHCLYAKATSQQYRVWGDGNTANILALTTGAVDLYMCYVGWPVHAHLVGFFAVNEGEMDRPSQTAPETAAGGAAPADGLGQCRAARTQPKSCLLICMLPFIFFFLSSFFFFFFPLIKTTFTVGEVEKTSSVLPDSKWLSRNSELYKARWFSRFDLNPAIASGQCPSVAEKRRITKRTVKIPSL